VRTTGKVIWHTTMSLDGYIADQNDDITWAFGHGGSLAPTLDEIVDRTGAVLMGRRLYDLGATGSPEVKLYGGAYTGPVFVVTHRPPGPSGGETGDDVTFVSTGVHDAVREARAAADGRDVIVMGASVASQCLAEGLVDELLIHQVPVLLGRGVRLYEGPARHPFNLETIQVTPQDQITNLRYRVRRLTVLE
jgi:dihydrofolate reductase